MIELGQKPRAQNLSEEDRALKSSCFDSEKPRGDEPIKYVCICMCSGVWRAFLTPGSRRLSGRGESHMIGTGMLVGNFELNPP